MIVSVTIDSRDDFSLLLYALASYKEKLIDLFHQQPDLAVKDDLRRDVTLVSELLTDMTQGLVEAINVAEDSKLSEAEKAERERIRLENRRRRQARYMPDEWLRKNGGSEPEK